MERSVGPYSSGNWEREAACPGQTVFHLWTFRDGMPWRCDVFFSEAEALEAAGLSE